MFRRITLQDRLSITVNASVIELLEQDQCLEMSQLDRYKGIKLLIHNYSVHFTDNAALFGILDEVFVRENYKFSCEKGSNGQLTTFFLFVLFNKASLKRVLISCSIASIWYHITLSSCESNFGSSHRMKNGLDPYGSYDLPAPMQWLMRITTAIEWLLRSRREFLTSPAKKEDRSYARFCRHVHL